MNPSASSILIHDHDLPEGVGEGASVAVDTEAMGLVPWRDRLCLVQLRFQDGPCHLVRIYPGHRPGQSPRLEKLLAAPEILKIFHFARFDMGILKHTLGVMPHPVYCTKIASRFARTYTDKHGLKDVCKELLGVDISKEEQTSDWGAETLTSHQQRYAAQDVVYLHRLKEKLNDVLIREDRCSLAQGCFEYLPTRVAMDLLGMERLDPLNYFMTS